MNMRVKEAAERLKRSQSPPFTGKTIRAQSGSHGNGWPAPCGVIDSRGRCVTGEGFLISALFKMDLLIFSRCLCASVWVWATLQVQDGAGGQRANGRPVFQPFPTRPGGVFVLLERKEELHSRPWEQLGRLLGTQRTLERRGRGGHSRFEHMRPGRPHPRRHPVHGTVGAVRNKPALFSPADRPRRPLRLLHPAGRRRGQGLWPCSSAKHWGGESGHQLESQSAAGIFPGDHRLLCSGGQSKAAGRPEEGAGRKHQREDVSPPKCQLM